jgi:hypothetical protein
MQSSGNDMSFVHCRVQPFSTASGVMLNDGSNLARIVYDSKVYATITAAPSQTVLGNIYIQIVPWLPYCALIKSGVPGNIAINGNSLSTSSDFFSGWYPIMAQGLNNVETGRLITTQPPVNAGKARLLTQGFRLIYTGPAFDVAGIITVTSGSQTVQAAAPAIAGSGVTADDPFTSVPINFNGTPVPYTSGAILAVSDQYTVNSDVSDSYAPDTVTYRTEVGCHGVLRRNSQSYEFQPVLKNAAFIFDPNATVLMNSSGAFYLPSYVASPVAVSPVTTVGTGIYWWDNEWDTINIGISGANVDASFRLEIVQCFEFVPEATSVFRPLAKRPGTNNKAQQLLADDHLAKQPVAIPANAQVPMPTWSPRPTMPYNPTFTDDLLDMAGVLKTNGTDAVKTVASLLKLLSV